MIKKYVAAAAVAFSLHAWAGPVDDALDRYQVQTKQSLAMCRLKLDMVRLMAENDALTSGAKSGDARAEFKSCVDQGRVDGKKNLNTALASVKKPRLKEALKNYQVAYLTALQAIAPGTDERKISYEQRQQGLDDKLTEAWSKVEVEE
jgi:hypothetical protein